MAVYQHTITDIKEQNKERKLNPLELAQGVFNGRPLLLDEMEALFSFAMDNLMSFDDMPEVFEQSFQKVLQKKMEHYKSNIPSIEKQAANHLAFCKNQI